MNDPSITIAALCAGFGVGYAIGWTNAIKAASQAVNGVAVKPRRMTYAQKLEWHRRRRMIRDGEIFEEAESLVSEPEPLIYRWKYLSKAEKEKHLALVGAYRMEDNQ